MGGLIWLNTYIDIEEAVVAQGYLRAQGVDALLFGEDHTTVDVNLRLAVGGYRIMVFAEEFDAASRIIRDVEIGGRLGTIEEECCEQCGAGEFKKRRDLIWVVLAILWHVAYAPYARRKRCVHCNAKTYCGGRILLRPVLHLPLVAAVLLAAGLFIVAYEWFLR